MLGCRSQPVTNVLAPTTPHLPVFCTPVRRRSQYTAKCKAVNTLTLPSPLDPYLNTIDYSAIAACEAAGCTVKWVGLFFLYPILNFLFLNIYYIFEALRGRRVHREMGGWVARLGWWCVKWVGVGW